MEFGYNGDDGVLKRQFHLQSGWCEIVGESLEW